MWMNLRSMSKEESIESWKSPVNLVLLEAAMTFKNVSVLDSRVKFLDFWCEQRHIEAHGELKSKK